MHPHKLALLVILLPTLGTCAVLLLGRKGGPWLKLGEILLVGLLGSFSLAATYSAVMAISRGEVALAKHGSRLIFTLAESPFTFLVCIAMFCLLAIVMFCGAVRIAKGELRRET